MKTKTYKLLLLILLHTVLCTQSYGQLFEFTRGHTVDDLYVSTATENPYNGRNLLYLTANGNILNMENNTELFYIELLAETNAGTILGHTDSWFGISTDYGKNFSPLALYINYYTTLFNLYGGEIPGEYITLGYDVSVYPYPCGVIHKTTDYAAHLSLVADTSDGIWDGEPGHISGEFYQMPLRNGHAFLSRSLDFGATFDSIPVDTNVINVNTGLNFGELSRGKQPGELFLVSKTVVSASEIHYSIYHTSDYGHTWVLKSTKVFDSERQKFTGGRAACSFYIANLKTTPNSTYYTLQIYYSADCGETFTLYEHMLTPDVGLSDNAKSDGSLCISPNPAKDLITLDYTVKMAGKVNIRLYSSDGKLLDLLLSERQNPGTHSLKYTCGQLRPGMYSIGMTDASGKTVSCKFIVGR